MKVKVNEKWIEVCESKDLYSLKKEVLEEADIVVLNGYPINENKVLKENDRVVFIKKGIVPTKDELEALMVSRHSPGVHEKLKKLKVCIAGCGGLGSNIAISLARLGIGYIKLIDFDVVEPSNLNRQQYYIDDIGEFKSLALKKNIERINPFIKVEAEVMLITEDNMDVLNEVNVVLEAFDNAEYKAMLSNYVLRNMREKYLIVASGMAGFYDSNLIKTRKITDKFYLCGDEVNEAKEGDGLMAPRVAICANHMANLVLKIAVEKWEEV